MTSPSDWTRASMISMACPTAASGSSASTQVIILLASLPHNFVAARALPPRRLELFSPGREISRVKAAECHPAPALVPGSTKRQARRHARRRVAGHYPEGVFFLVVPG